MVVVLANTIFTATIKHTHNPKIDKRNLEIYHKIEVNKKTRIIYLKNSKIFFLDFIYNIF